MEFERPDTPIPESSTKKRRKNSAESDLEQPKKQVKESKQPSREWTAGKVPAEAIANLLKPQKSFEREPFSKKKKKKKHGGVEPAETVTQEPEENLLEVEHDEALGKPKAAESRKGSRQKSESHEEETETHHKDHESAKANARYDSEKTDKDNEAGLEREENAERPGYHIDEIIEIELEGNREAVVALRLPEVNEGKPEQGPAKTEESWNFAEALEEVEEQLAAEAAGITLPEHYMAEPPKAEAAVLKTADPEEVEISDAPEAAEATSLQTPEEIMTVVSEAYGTSANDGGEGNLPEVKETVERVIEKTRVEKTTQTKDSRVLKKLNEFEDSAHQKLKGIWQFSEKSAEQTAYPNRRDQRLERIGRNQVRFENRRRKDERRQDTYERLIVNKAAQFSKDNLPEEARLIQEQLDIPENHRLERSAWLNIEVDKKTGRAVENPTIAYGEEFHREKHQEALEAEPEEVAVASGQLAVGGAGTVNLGRQLSASSAASAKLANRSRELYNRLESTIPIRNYKPNSVADLALWVALMLVITAIIIVA